jgi:hypothetical protein
MPSPAPPAETAPFRKSEPQKHGGKRDVFISHASEDKAYVEPLVTALEDAGISVWYDRLVLQWGDDLRQAIDNGLVNCRYGIVILSKAFLGKKKWTEHELNGLFAREQAGKKLVLPIWHGITRDDLLAYSPALADRLAKISENDSYENIVNSLLGIIGRSSAAPTKPTHSAAMPSGIKPNAIAFAQYEGPAGRRVHLLIRKSATEEDVFTLEDADGELHQGSSQNIAIKYVSADKKLIMNGFKRMQNSGGSEYPEFNL